MVYLSTSLSYMDELYREELIQGPFLAELDDSLDKCMVQTF